MSAKPELTSWDHRQATLALSKTRRKALKVFADSVGPGLTKPEAIYALIDAALPLKPLPAPNPEAQATREIARRSADALEMVAAALAPLEGLISGEREAPALAADDTGPPSALGPAEWIGGALARLNMSPGKLSLTMHCRAIDLAGPRALLRFEVSRLELDGDARYAANAALPALRLAINLLPRSSDISLGALACSALLRCERGPRGWSCELLSEADPSREPMHRFEF